jgi:transcriptional regulator with XRE-family HTH domain
VQKLSLRKQLAIVRLYLSGFSYDEIAAQAGVSKGTVANVIMDLKAGRILNIHETAEQLELLRELAVDLRRLRLNPGQAVAGLAVLSHLQTLGIEPAHVERWAAMCRELAPQGTEAQVFARAALALKELRERTGLSAEALEAKARSLEEEVARLEPLVQKLKGCQQEVKQLEKRRQSLSDEVCM